MARAPFQIFVLPYRKSGETDIEYALLRRTDEGYWHAIAGGAEGQETPLQAARRETFEETGLPEDSIFLKLDTIFYVPVTIYQHSEIWGDDLFVIPSYCFGVQVEMDQIRLSEEHLEYKWVKYEEALHMLHYETNKVALWELDRKLRGLGPRDHAGS